MGSSCWSNIAGIESWKALEAAPTAPTAPGRLVAHEIQEIRAFARRPSSKNLLITNAYCLAATRFEGFMPEALIWGLRPPQQHLPFTKKNQ
ncbi:hypothetical protein ACN38_g13032 [Penicillium nordicum]|uniref:Uncharacterized protein n=1 Tax=Penicillium nordicum TaxID=229535 RepID=A0A0M9W9F7_9EURO|nr:hypothetical protein ACN38_g13032 [Penicillium nordicum]